LLVVSSCGACGESRTSQPARPATANPGAQSDVAAKHMRVMSYNLNFGVAGDRSNIDAIEAAHPDIVFLQESNDEWERALVGRLGEQYPHRRFDPPSDWVAGGMGILSKYPIVAVDVLVAPRAPFFAWRVVLDSALGKIQVFNLHLRPPMSDGGSWVVGYFSTRDDRLREIQYHLEAFDPKLPALFVGDFNEDRDVGKAIALLEERGFVDAIAQAHGDKPTWQWPVGSMTLRMQLDHLMYSAHLMPANVTIVDAGRSDHKPIWADFERSDP
jgi:endonuclease/exonuclease/phosphatase (EEP) superfamily protein YafD